MKKSVGVLILVLIFVLILLVISIFFLIKSTEKDYAGDKRNAENKKISGIGGSNGNEQAGNLVNNANMGKIGNNAGSLDISGNLDGITKTLPSDIDSAECGFYFSEFGACAGTCPSGTCSSEGRSCYCKKE